MTSAWPFWGSMATSKRSSRLRVPSAHPVSLVQITYYGRGWRSFSKETAMSASLAPPKTGMQPSPANIRLMQLTSAYWTSGCLHVVAELGLADHLSHEPQSPDALAKATVPKAGPPYRVLRFIVLMRVFEWKDGSWDHSEASRF